jgi:hypothetical protein
MSKSEIWVCKVLMHQGPLHGPMRIHELTAKSHQHVMQKVIDGELAVCSTDNAILEPLEQFSTEPAAAANRDDRAKRDPAGEYRVVLSVAVG